MFNSIQNFSDNFNKTKSKHFQMQVKHLRTLELGLINARKQFSKFFFFLSIFIFAFLYSKMSAITVQLMFKIKKKSCFFPIVYSNILNILKYTFSHLSTSLFQIICVKPSIQPFFILDNIVLSDTSLAGII